MFGKVNINVVVDNYDLTDNYFFNCFFFVKHIIQIIPFFNSGV